MEHGDQKKAAQRAGISQARMHYFLTGRKRAWRTAKAIAAAFNADPALIMDASRKQIEDIIDAANINLTECELNCKKCA